VNGVAEPLHLMAAAFEERVDEVNDARSGEHQSGRGGHVELALEDDTKTTEGTLGIVHERAQRKRTDDLRRVAMVNPSDDLRKLARERQSGE